MDGDRTKRRGVLGLVFLIAIVVGVPFILFAYLRTIGLPPTVTQEGRLGKVLERMIGTRYSREIGGVVVAEFVTRRPDRSVVPPPTPGVMYAIILPPLVHHGTWRDTNGVVVARVRNGWGQAAAHREDGSILEICKVENGRGVP